jgi:RNA polymerase sigma factor (sigma-70 family)
MHNQEFVDLYDQYFDKIYQFVFYRTMHKELAEDLTSQVFMKAWEKFDTYDTSKGSFSAWIYQIARNTIIDNHRTRKDFVDLESAAEPEVDPRFAENIDASNSLSRIRQYLNGFSEEQRSIVIMRVWDELSYKEIADILGKSEASCKMSFSRSMAKIHKEFGSAALVFLLISKLF